MPISFALAGTSEHSAQCAAALLNTIDPQFELKYILTPEPRPVGRKKILTPSPVTVWAEKTSLSVPIISLEKKIDINAKNKILEQENIDFLLVVDFGFFIPQWLLKLPRIFPLNIHPSDLPKYRGASPGQFVLLYGETESAVTLMIPNNKMDEGDILAKIKFTVDQNWHQNNYYDHAFRLICQQLPDLVKRVATGEIKPQPQPSLSPTPPARQLQKTDAFVPWKKIRPYLAHIDKFFPQESLTYATNDLNNKSKSALPPNAPTLLHDLFSFPPSHLTSAHLLDRAIHAFNPWPPVWTFFPHRNGKLIRLQLIDCAYDVQNDLVQLKAIRFEGRPLTTF